MAVDYTNAIYTDGPDLGVSPEALFSGTVDDWWSAGSYPPQWCQVQLATEQKVTQYSISGHWAYANSPSDWEILGSNDGSTWTTLDTQTGQNVVNLTSPLYPLLVSNLYLYYRLNVTATTGGNLPVVHELTFTDAPSTPPMTVLTPYNSASSDILIPIVLSGIMSSIFPPPTPPVDFSGLADPTVAPTLTKSDTADGHLLVGTYRYSYAAWKGTPAQATAPSPTADITLTAEDTVTLTYPTIAGADGYLVYREDL